MLLKVADRVEGAVTAHVLPVPERLRAARLFVTVLTALFVVVAVACAAGAEWAAATAYGVLCVGCGVFRRRFLRSMRTRV